MPITDVTQWDKWVRTNQHPYGKECVDLAMEVMHLLDQANGEFDTHALVLKARDNLATTGLDGHMAAAAAEIVSACHSRGQEFEHRWNADHALKVVLSKETEYYKAKFNRAQQANEEAWSQYQSLDQAYQRQLRENSKLCKREAAREKAKELTKLRRQFGRKRTQILKNLRDVQWALMEISGPPILPDSKT